MAKKSGRPARVPSARALCGRRSQAPVSGDALARYHPDFNSVGGCHGGLHNAHYRVDASDLNANTGHGKTLMWLANNSGTRKWINDDSLAALQRSSQVGQASHRRLSH